MVDLPDGIPPIPGERWLPAAISVALLAATAALVVVDSGDGTEVLVGAVLPFLLAARLGWHALAGRGEWDAGEVRRITAWILAGGAVMVLVGSWFALLERVFAVELSAGMAILTSIAAGALLGMQVGRYGVRARRKVAEATRARLRRRHAERSRERIALLNRIIRHHMRNAVNVIGAAAEIAADHADEEGRRHLETVQERSADLAEKVETFQRISETLAGAVPVAERDLAADLAEAVRDAREAYPGATVVVSGTVPDVEVYANDLLVRVLYAQLENGIEHNDRAEPTVEVTVEADPGTVTVAVADDGPGLPDDRKDLVFEAGDSGVTTEGDGLELFLARAVLDRYGGTIRVRDNDPRGAVFETVLPRADGTAPPDGDRVAVPGPDAAPGDDGRPGPEADVRSGSDRSAEAPTAPTGLRQE